MQFKKKKKIVPYDQNFHQKVFQIVPIYKKLYENSQGSTSSEIGSPQNTELI